MPYATTDQLLERLGSDVAALLADEDGDAVADVSILTAALDDATAQIDAALSRRYAVPFDPAPERLLRLTIDLAVYHLYRRRREAMPDETESAYTRATSELRDLAAGRAQLDGAIPRVPRLNVESTTLDQPRRFDRESLEPF